MFITDNSRGSRALLIGTAAATILAVTAATSGAAGATSPVPGPSERARAGEFEPNDFTAQATALGASGTTYAAAVETESDVDLFEFYVAVHGSQVFFPVSNTTQGAELYESISAEIRDAEGTVLSSSDWIDVGESETVSYSLPAGRYYLAIDSAYSDNNLVRTYTFPVQGSTVDAATMQAICDQSLADAAVATKRLRRAKKALRRAKETHDVRKVRKARARLKTARVAKRRADRRTVTYCVVL